MRFTISATLLSIRSSSTFPHLLHRITQWRIQFFIRLPTVRRMQPWMMDQWRMEWRMVYLLPNCQLITSKFNTYTLEYFEQFGF